MDSLDPPPPSLPRVASAPTGPRPLTDETLRTVSHRTLTFLEGAADPGVLAVLTPLGWNAASAEEAWALLRELCSNTDPAGPNVVLESVAACEEWMETGFVRARTLLELKLPEQAAFVSSNLHLGKRYMAVMDVHRFLEHRRALARDPRRRASRKADREALRLLEHVGVTDEKAAELAALVDAARTASPGTASTAFEEKRKVTRKKLHAWLTAWSEIARTGITKRRHLILLGIAKRRPRK